MPPPPETLVDHQSSPFDHQPPRSRGFKAREEEPLVNHPSSLFVQQPSRRRELKFRQEEEEYDFVKLGTDSNHHISMPKQRPSPNLKDLEGLDFSSRTNIEEDGVYDQPQYQDGGRQTRFRDYSGIQIPRPRDLEQDFNQIFGKHPLLDPRFTLNMRTYRPRVVEIMDERQQQNQSETLDHQLPERGRARGHQELNTTWDSSSSEDVDTGLTPV